MFNDVQRVCVRSHYYIRSWWYNEKSSLVDQLNPFFSSPEWRIFFSLTDWFSVVYLQDISSSSVSRQISENWFFTASAVIHVPPRKETTMPTWHPKIGWCRMSIWGLNLENENHHSFRCDWCVFLFVGRACRLPLPWKCPLSDTPWRMRSVTGIVWVLIQRLLFQTTCSFLLKEGGVEKLLV